MVCREPTVLRPELEIDRCPGSGKLGAHPAEHAAAGDAAACRRAATVERLRRPLPFTTALADP